jgi:hypothetical protein
MDYGDRVFPSWRKKAKTETTTTTTTATTTTTTTPVVAAANIGRSVWRPPKFNRWKDIYVPTDYQRTAGRGPPKPVTLARHLRDHGYLMECIGLTPGEISGVQDVSSKFKENNAQTWVNAIPSWAFLDGVEENRTIIHRLYAKPPPVVVSSVAPPKKKRRKLSPSSSSSSSSSAAAAPVSLNLKWKSSRGSCILVEHYELQPLAYGIKGIIGSCLCLHRQGPSHTVPGKWFVPVNIPKDDPFPSMYEVDEGLNVLYVHELGMFPLTEVTRTSQDFFVSQGEMYEVDTLYLSAPLEPACAFPTPKEFASIETMLKRHPERCSPAKLCMYRSCKTFHSRTTNLEIKRQTYELDHIVMLQAQAICIRLVNYESEIHTALGHPKPKLKEYAWALKHVYDLVCQSPWVRSYCYYWLFHKRGDQHSKFTDETTMSVMGSHGHAADYIPDIKHIFAQQKEAAHIVEEGKKIIKDVVSSNKRKRSLTSIELEKKALKEQAFDDIRKADTQELNKILRMIGVPIGYFAPRWDKSWIIQKFASSKMGLRFPQLRVYIRRDQKSAENIYMRVSKEELNVHRDFEKRPYFMMFRTSARRLWDSFCSLGAEQQQQQPKPQGTTTTTTTTTTAIDDDVIDEFSAELVANLFNHCESNTAANSHEEREGETFEEFQSRVKHYYDMVRAHMTWLRTVTDGRDKIKSLPVTDKRRIPSYATIEISIVIVENNKRKRIDDQVIAKIVL